MQDFVTLSLIQGITEFIPVSSTAHMMVGHTLFNLSEFGRIAEVSAHVGTLLVVFVYFWRDIFAMVDGFFSFFKKKMTEGSWLFLYLVLATLPVVIAGYILHRYGGTFGRSFHWIGWASIASGFMLYLVDKGCPTSKKLSEMGLKDATLIGLIQAVSLLPGASRLGMTIIGARLLGYKRTEAARFSFLLSIPAVLGAATLISLDLMKEDQFLFGSEDILMIAISFGVGLITLFVVMRWLRSFSFVPFAIYRILFGIGLLWYF